MIKHIPTFTFPAMPTFHQLWSACMEQHLTSSVEAMEVLFRENGITKASKLLDTCVGAGDTAVHLLSRGYNIATVDGDPNMLELFRKKLAVECIVHEPKLAKWHEIPRVFAGKAFDGLICCGNSIIYAGGYWNHDGVIDREKSLAGIRRTLSIFCGRLSPGGCLFVEKPSDNEQPTEDLVACINVAGDVYDVFFSVRFAGDRRNAQILLRHQVTGQELGTPNVVYRLKNAELEELLLQAGFASFERVAGGVNSHLPLWVAKVL